MDAGTQLSPTTIAAALVERINGLAAERTKVAARLAEIDALFGQFGQGFAPALTVEGVVCDVAVRPGNGFHAATSQPIQTPILRRPPKAAPKATKSAPSSLARRHGTLPTKILAALKSAPNMVVGAISVLTLLPTGLNTSARAIHNVLRRLSERRKTGVVKVGRGRYKFDPKRVVK